MKRNLLLIIIYKRLTRSLEESILKIRADSVCMFQIALQSKM